jgi:hypothetical protein
MTRLSPDKKDRFLSRFYGCHDSVLRAVKILWATDNRADVILTLSVRDIQGKDGEEWVNVRLKIAAVEEICLKESSKVGYTVLSNGIQIGVFEDLILFDLDPYTLEPEGIQDYRRSRFYFAGRDFAWKVEPYKE